MRWPWLTPSTDPAHVRASEAVLDRLDEVANRIEQAHAELVATIEAEREHELREGGGG